VRNPYSRESFDGDIYKSVEHALNHLFIVFGIMVLIFLPAYYLHLALMGLADVVLGCVIISIILVLFFASPGAWDFIVTWGFG
jgi:hypothetical protein